MHHSWPRIFHDRFVGIHLWLWTELLSYKLCSVNGEAKISWAIPACNYPVLFTNSDRTCVSINMNVRSILSTIRRIYLTYRWWVASFIHIAMALWSIEHHGHGEYLLISMLSPRTVPSFSQISLLLYLKINPFETSNHPLNSEPWLIWLKNIDMVDHDFYG